MIDEAILTSELRRLREANAPKDGASAAGIILLKDMLSSAIEEDDRYLIYRHLVSELTLLGDFEGALEWAQKRFAEFKDIVSHGTVASALIESGRQEDGLREYYFAFRAAINNNELVNFTFGELMRAAIKIKEAFELNSLIAEFFALKLPKTKADCALEDDWLDAAEALGARQDLIKKLRRRARRG